MLLRTLKDRRQYRISFSGRLQVPVRRHDLPRRLHDQLQRPQGLGHLLFPARGHGDRL